MIPFSAVDAITGPKADLGNLPPSRSRLSLFLSVRPLPTPVNLVLLKLSGLLQSHLYRSPTTRPLSLDPTYAPEPRRLGTRTTPVSAYSLLGPLQKHPVPSSALALSVLLPPRRTRRPGTEGPKGDPEPSAWRPAPGTRRVGSRRSRNPRKSGAGEGGAGAEGPRGAVEAGPGLDRWRSGPRRGAHPQGGSGRERGSGRGPAGGPRPRGTFCGEGAALTGRQSGRGGQPRTWVPEKTRIL